MDNLNILVSRFSFRIRLRDGWQLAQRGLWLPISLAIFVQVIGRFRPTENLLAWTLTPLVAWFISMFGIVALRPMPSLNVARRVDIELGLKERLSTALVLQEWPNAFPTRLTQAQQHDALATARTINPATAFPFVWMQRHLLIASIMCGCLLALIWLPNPMDSILAQRAAIAQAAEEQAAQIEKLRQQVEDSQELSPEERQELLRQLNELSEALRSNPGDLEEALADLSRVEESLRERLDPGMASQQANLESLASRLESLAGLQTNPNRDQLDTAAAALSELAKQVGSMNETQHQELAEALAQLSAQSAQAGDAALAQALSTLAQAAQSGDQQAVSQAAQSIQSALERTQSQLAGQETLQAALAQLQSSRQALSQAGQSLAQSQAASSGQGQNQGQGQGQGQGQNPGQGQPGGGGGSQSNTLPPGSGQGKAQPPKGSAPDTPAGELQGQVYTPWQRSQGNGEQVFIPGQDSNQGETQVKEGQGTLPGAANPALVSYREVYYSYLNAANQAMQQGYIPASLADFIRAYFSQLEP